MGKKKYGPSVMANGRMFAAPPDEVKPVEPKPLVIAWTKTDARTAQKQGWDLFDCGDRYELENVTDLDRFQSDDEVITHCIKQALAGDKTCIKALLLCSLLDPHWMAADYTNQVLIEAVTMRGMDRTPTLSRSHVTYETHPSKLEQ